MNFLGRIYKRNIYGVMGTLIFHILLFSAFLLAEIDMKGNIKEEPLFIEFPDLLPEDEPELPKEETLEESSKDQNDAANNLTNRASNRLAQNNITESTDDFFNDDYMQELNDAKNLSSNVKNQLAKEKVKFEDIKMPVETTEGMDPDSIKNVVYSGESNIVYYLENRYHISLPIPIYLAQGGGKVIIEIWVDRNGTVTDAKLQTGQRIRDDQLINYAIAAALQTRFNADSNAPSSQKGTIHYNFIAQ